VPAWPDSLAPVDTRTDPDDAEADDPLDSSTSPLPLCALGTDDTRARDTPVRLSAPPADVSTDVVLTPAFRLNEPPSAPAPAASDTDPPRFPAPPLDPTDRAISPDTPEDALPVRIDTDPLSPDASASVLVDWIVTDPVEP